jgi:hypothetical protein
MTICVSVRVAEGLVMAADSAVTLQGDVVTPAGVQRHVLQSFEYATKVAQVGGLPMGVMTWGLGSISSRSIQSLVMEFEFGYTPTRPLSVKTVADDLLAFILARYAAAYPKPTDANRMGLFFGGYSDGEFFSTQLSVELPSSRTWHVVRPDKAPGVPDFGANWYGATDALQRLILGFDPTSLDKLVARGADKTIVKAWIDAHEPALQLVFDGMPLQDAIDFADWAANVVIGRYRFGMGANIVGGDIDIAVIRPRSFQWAQRKRWSIKDDQTGPSLMDRSLGRDPQPGLSGDGLAGEPGLQRADATASDSTAGPKPRAQPRGPRRGSTTRKGRRK